MKANQALVILHLLIMLASEEDPPWCHTWQRQSYCHYNFSTRTWGASVHWCGCWANRDAHGGLEVVRVSAESLLACTKRLANTNSYSIFTVASVTSLPKVTDICFLWLDAVIFILRGQFFIPTPSAEEQMSLVACLGGEGGKLW